MARSPRNPFAPIKPSRPGRPGAFGRDPYKEPKAAKPRNRAMEATLCQAMQGKRLAAFRYRLTDHTDRIVAPHVVWITEAEGACMFGIQLQSETGAAESSPQHFDPYKITNLRILDRTFEPDQTFKRDRYSDVICMVPR